MGSAFKAVFLDIGGTVLETNDASHEVYVEILRWHGYDVTNEDAKVWLDGARRESRRLPSGRNDGDFTISPERERARRDLMVESFLRRAGVENGFNALLEAIYHSWIGTKVFPMYSDASLALRALKEAGLIVAAVSNWESRLPALLASHGVRDYFDLVVSSESEGYAKPGTRLFELALERTGLAPEQVLYVGDDPESDVRVPESLGMRSVYLQRRPDRPFDHSPRLTSLEPLVSLATAQALIRGRAERGNGEAAQFTQLDWVRQQLSERLGVDAFPGTLNLRLDESRDINDWERLCQQPGVTLDPSPGYCAARCYPVWVEASVPGAVVLPMVPDYPRDIVEVVAPESLRATLGLDDGSMVSLAFPGPAAPD